VLSITAVFVTRSLMAKETWEEFQCDTTNRLCYLIEHAINIKLERCHALRRESMLHVSSSLLSLNVLT